MMNYIKISLMHILLAVGALCLSAGVIAQISPENLYMVGATKSPRVTDPRAGVEASFDQNSELNLFDEGYIAPYGANLFTGDYSAHRSDGLNDAYLVAPGDKISVQLWGTVRQAEVLTVDNQGNIFVTEVGPINVQDVPAL